MPLKKQKMVIKGEHDVAFPLDVFQTALVQALTWIKQVIVALASQASKLKIHPNDDVNMSQSSNDVIPTAICIRCIIRCS